MTLLFTLFFSRPVGIVLMANLAMFCYSAKILKSLQINRSKYRRQTSSNSQSKELSSNGHSNGTSNLHRQFSRQLSSAMPSNSININVKKRKADVER